MKQINMPLSKDSRYFSTVIKHGSQIFLDFFFLSKNYGDFLKFYLFIYFWLCWIFVAAHRLSLVAASGATLHCGARASTAVASLVAEHGL